MSKSFKKVMFQEQLNSGHTMPLMKSDLNILSQLSVYFLPYGLRASFIQKVCTHVLELGNCG